MGFSGVRALTMIVLLVALGAGVFKFGLPGWILPVGLLVGGTLLKGWETKSTT